MEERRMRHLLATTVAALLGLSLFSSPSPTAAAETALGTSAWSLEIGTDLGTGNSGASIAIRRHSGASSAFRFGIDANLDKFEGDGTRTETGTADEDVNQDNQNSNVALSIQWMRFAPIRSHVTATFAVGPVVTMNRGFFRVEDQLGLPGFSGFEVSSRSTQFGLDLGLGVEWFFNSRFSLGGQAGLRGTTGTSKQVNINRSGTAATYSITETQIDSDVTEISTENTRIHLTMYF
jgi:hypothetical protein